MNDNPVEKVRSTLTPAQQRAAEQLQGALPKGCCFVLWSADGLGRTTVLREMHRRLGGARLTMRDVVDHTSIRHPLALEESFYRIVWDALVANDVVIVDDMHLLHSVWGGGCRAYPRAEYYAVPLMALVSYAAEAGKKLIFGAQSHAPAPIHERAFYIPLEEFTVDDYAFLCGALLGNETAGQLNYALIHRFAPKLTAHQIVSTCAWLKGGTVTTDTFIEYLRSQRMASNVDLGEVQQVNLHDLKGMDDLIESLEANIVVPLENEKLAEELNIRPKRGVLLVGPPGTGKTTVGRALAHRLKGKFYLIDGTFISGTGGFYQMIQLVFEAAKQNAPAVIFIDDSDVIFENGQEAGLYRYLLTMLDGLESRSAGRICVMMTAMNVASLPPALIRSGRIELWLETRLPDAMGRLEILRDAKGVLPAAMGEIDVERLVTVTEGMTGADLKRLLDDGKVLFAHDVARTRPTQPAIDYFLKAAHSVRENKERYADAEAQARSRGRVRPPWFDVQAFASMADINDPS